MVSEVMARRALRAADTRAASKGATYACPLCDRALWPIPGHYLSHLDSAHPEVPGSLAP